MPRLLLHNLALWKGSPLYTCSHHMPEVIFPAGLLHVQLLSILPPLSWQNPMWEKEWSEAGWWEQSAPGRCALQTRANNAGESAFSSPASGQAANMLWYTVASVLWAELFLKAQGRVWWRLAHSRAGSRCACSRSRQKVPCHATYVLSTWPGEWCVAPNSRHKHMMLSVDDQSII